MKKNPRLPLFDNGENGNFVADSYTGIYAMHKYWSKKPYNIMRSFVEAHTQPKDVVLDPFCGSGVSVIESVVGDRKAIGIDINPAAIFITRQALQLAPVKELEEAFESIRDRLQPRINSFYRVERSGKFFQGTHYLWNRDKLVELWCFDDAGKKQVMAPHESDADLADSFVRKDIEDFYPQDLFFHNGRINADGSKSIADLFTCRNLKALSLIMAEIEKVGDSVIRDLLRFSFTSSVGQASKMVFVIKRRGKMDNKSQIERKEVGSWVIGYWRPKEYFEINAWNCFENKFRKVLRAKKAQQESGHRPREASQFQDLVSTDANTILFNLPAQLGLKRIPDNSVDYVITDPPHGNRIPYLELSMMWNSWLKNEVDYHNEIVVSDSKGRKKDIHDYNALLNSVFEEIYRVLKPGRYFSLMFNSLDDHTWINVISKLYGLNLILEKVETLSYSANSVVQDTRTGALKSDFIITFAKNISAKTQELNILTLESDESELRDGVAQAVKNESPNQNEQYQLLNRVFRHFLNQHKFFRVSEIVGILTDSHPRTVEASLGK